MSLHRSLNCMSPKAQRSGLSSLLSAAPVTSILAPPATDFVLTARAVDASVNVWMTQVGLTRVHGLNFKLQACIDPRDSLKRAQLHFLS